MCLLSVRLKKPTKFMGDRIMKKTMIPMAILVATLLTGCSATNTVAKTNNNSVNETPVTNITEEQTIDDVSDAQTAESTTAPVIDTVEPENVSITEPATTAAPVTSALAGELENYPAYKNLVSDIRTAISEGNQSIYELSPGIAMYKDSYDGPYVFEDTVTVSLYDINKDGTPELFFGRRPYDGPGMLILEMYTLSGDNAIKVISDDEYGFYAYDLDLDCLFHLDDTQIMDIMALNGTTLDITESFIPDDYHTCNKGLLPGTSDILFNL